MYSLNGLGIDWTKVTDGVNKWSPVVQTGVNTLYPTQDGSVNTNIFNPTTYTPPPTGPRISNEVWLVGGLILVLGGMFLLSKN